MPETTTTGVPRCDRLPGSRSRQSASSFLQPIQALSEPVWRQRILVSSCAASAAQPCGMSCPVHPPDVALITLSYHNVTLSSEMFILIVDGCGAS
jgi:hypothetical protein